MSAGGLATESAAAAVEVHHVSKRYDGRTVLSEVSFRAGGGEVTALFGARGSGKTTALRIILGLAQPDEGSVLVLGRTYRQLDHPARQVGAMLDASGFHPGRSALDHLRLGALQAGLPPERVEDVLSLAGLQDYARVRVGEYTRDQRRRLGIAAALLGDPQVVVLDEPRAGLDDDGAAWLEELLRRLAAEGRAVLVTVQSRHELDGAVDHVVGLNAGLYGGEARSGPRQASQQTVAARGLPRPPAALPDERDLDDRLQALRWSSPPQRVFAVVAVKGGVGRTTVSLALADTLAGQAGLNVACLDADASAGTLVAVAGGWDTPGLDALVDRAGELDAGTVRELALVRPSGAHVFGFPPGAPPSALGTEEYATLIDLLTRAYDTLVVDVAGSPFDALGALCLGRAHHAIVVTSGDVVVAATTARALEGLDPGRRTLVVNGTEARVASPDDGTGLRLPFDPSIGRGPWQPGDLAGATRVAVKRLAWTVGEAVR